MPRSLIREIERELDALIDYMNRHQHSNDKDYVKRLWLQVRKDRGLDKEDKNAK